MQADRSMPSPARITLLLTLAAVFSVTSHAQTAAAPRPEFEVAIVRVSKEGSGGIRGTNGRLTLEHVPLRVLISVAYKTRSPQVVGGPSWADSGWLDSVMFNVEGKAAEAAGTDTMLLMLQSLLEERFQLKIHHETKEGPVYELTLAKGGSRLTPATDCIAFDPNHLPRQTAPGETPVNYCGRMSRTGDSSPRTADAKGVPIDPAVGPLTTSLTGFLSEILDRTVINRTGLTGAFDFHLEWLQPQAEPLPLDDTGAPSLFTAVEEQLGLRLQAAKGPVDFLVIDRADKPAEN